MFTPSEKYREYLVSSKYCDADSETVISKAKEIAGNSKTPREAAMAVHSYVRDQFKFGFTPITEKASQTLGGTIGWCVTKTNLQIALLRAMGIPARYHQVALSKTVQQGIIGRTLYKQISDRIWFHPWCEVNLDDRWIACDLWIDSQTYHAAVRSGIYSKAFFPTVDWDGEHDLNIVDHWLIEDIGTHQIYDEVIERANEELSAGPAFILNFLVKRSNRVTARLREHYA
jgi:hypothetical protein